ncbi:hypothetical protein Leryth_019334 [Lithospermum erythrorhizon]|nr:hypothetical protein Leryth_019334 [Lithospermum erythrorhizon]
MGSRDDIDDDDFSDLYKEYTGPLGSKANEQQNNTSMKPRSTGSDEEQEERDPNAVPTDFTSREAKVWEAKSKATERNWKKKKEEELICKICGESGHFTQGCPSTLGASRKSQDFFERIAARESHVRALFTEKVVSEIEKDTGCKIRIDEKFIIVSGKDRLILKKGVNAVHKVKSEEEKKGPPSSVISRSRSRSPVRRSPVNSRFGSSASQLSNPSPRNASPFQHSSARHDKSVEDRVRLSNPSPRNASPFQHASARHDKAVEDRVREDLQKLSRGSPQVDLMQDLLKEHLTSSSFAEAYGNDGARAGSSILRSPMHVSHTGNTYNPYDGHSHGRVAFRADEWNGDRRGPEMQPARKFEYDAFPKTLEELELEYKREAMDLAKIRDKEEDEENYKHREAIREIRESSMKKLSALRDAQAKQWDEFLQLDARRPQQSRQPISTSGYGGYRRVNYPELENSISNPYYSGSSMPMEPRRRHSNSMEHYPPSRTREIYGDFEQQRREDFGKTYDRY